MIVRIIEGGYYGINLTGGVIFCFVRRFSEYAPISSKLDFWGIWDLATQLKILSHSKILPELGDIVVGSLKLSDFRKSPYKSFGKIVSKLSQN